MKKENKPMTAKEKENMRKYIEDFYELLLLDLQKASKK